MFIPRKNKTTWEISKWLYSLIQHQSLAIEGELQLYSLILHLFVTYTHFTKFWNFNSLRILSLCEKKRGREDQVIKSY